MTRREGNEQFKIVRQKYSSTAAMPGNLGRFSFWQTKSIAIPPQATE